MADAVVEAAAPAGEAQNNAKDTSNVESAQNENGAVKSHADSNEDKEEDSKSEKKSFNGNGSYSKMSHFVVDHGGIRRTNFSLRPLTITTRRPQIQIF
jgi:hypothetical protein